MSIARQSIAAVTVTYNPDLSRFRKVLSSLYKQHVSVVVVDNGSKNIASIERLLKGKSDLIKLGRNYGIAKALNVGVARCLKKRVEWIMTMDQDSIAANNGIVKILSNYDSLSQQTREKVGILILSGTTNYDGPYAEQFEENHNFVSAQFVITSGNIVKAEIFRSIKFREDFFIDQVDHEFDIRVRRKGFLILVSRAKLLDHSLGRVIRVNGKLITYHNEKRLYYFTRNSTYLARNYPEFTDRFYITGLLTMYSRFLKVNGLAGLPRATYIYFKAVRDGNLGNLGENKSIMNMKTIK